MKILNENPIHIIADEGMVLTNGETYSDQVYLGIHDSPDNWWEVLEDEDGDRRQIAEQNVAKSPNGNLPNSRMKFRQIAE